MAILKVIAQDIWNGIERALSDSGLQTDETTDMSVMQQMAIILRFLPARASEQGNVIGSVRISEGTVVLSM